MVQTLSPARTVSLRDYAWVPTRGSLLPELVRPVDTEARAWIRLPCQWILDGGLRLFRDEVAYRGRSTAALKILLTVALMAEEPDAGTLSGQRVSTLLSYADLNRLSGLSTILISAGKRFLCGHGLVAVAHEGQGRRIRYFLGRGSRLEPQAFIPCRHRAEGAWTRIETLHDLSCTQIHDLNALKIYLVLCALGGGRDLSVTVRSSLVCQLTNIPEAKIADAVGNLARRSLVSVQSAARHEGGDCLHLRPLPLR